MTRIYVSQKNIRANMLDDERRPVVSVVRDGTLTLCHEAGIWVKGECVARVVYRPQEAGTQVWVETEHEVRHG